MLESFQKVVSGKVCRLRPLEESDANITFQWRQMERAALLNKGAESVDQQRSWIKGRPNSEINFIIELVDGTPVGMLSLIKIDFQNKTAESARFLIGEEDMVKGKPVAVEAMLLLYQLAFDQMGLNRIYGTIAEKNKMMIKWQIYLGMKKEGVLRQHYCIDNKFQDAVVMGILKDDYINQAEKKMKVLAAW